MKITPRQKIQKLREENGDSGYHGTAHQFIILIENDLWNKATKIMNDIAYGFLWNRPRLIHNKIYNYLLDGYSVKKIKQLFKN